MTIVTQRYVVIAEAGAFRSTIWTAKMHQIQYLTIKCGMNVSGYSRLSKNEKKLGPCLESRPTSMSLFEHTICTKNAHLSTFFDYKI